MNIAILHCQKVSDTCPGSGCFKAFNEGTATFSKYEEKPTLSAFMHCGGCDSDWDTDPNMKKKIDRLKADGVERVHIGVCVGLSCDNREDIADMIERNGMEVVNEIGRAHV
jgi:predicted metal-binding protein